MNKPFRKLVFILSLLLFIPGLYAQDENRDDFCLFGSDEVLEVSLKFDMTTFLRDKSDDEYMDAELVYHFSERDSLINKIRVRCRGNSRLRICIHPPTRLNFKGCDNRPADLEGVSNVKLVTHCRDNKSYEDYLLKEYLAYRLYNVVTDTSFRVRLMHIRYIDTGAKGNVTYRYGFVIEPLDLLCSRLASVEREDVVVKDEYLEADSFDRLCMFQYMIGNDDWYLPNLHNLKLIEPAEGLKLRRAVVPYDFDYSGLVSAFYALPNDQYDLENIQDRVYMGPCRREDIIRGHMQYFLNHKDDFLAEIQKIDFNNEKEKKRTSKYIESFFAEYKRDLLLYNIRKTCSK